MWGRTHLAKKMNAPSLSQSLTLTMSWRSSLGCKFPMNCSCLLQYRKKNDCFCDVSSSSFAESSEIDRYQYLKILCYPGKS